MQEDELIFRQKVEQTNLEVIVAGIISDDKPLMEYLHYIVK